MASSSWAVRARPAAATAHETDRLSIAAMSCSRRSAFLQAFCPACSSTAWRRWRRRSSVLGCRRRPGSPGFRSYRSRESRSSYNGLLVFLFIAMSASLAAVAIHRLASRSVRSAAMGLRLSGRQPRGAIYGGELRPANPPRFRRFRFPGEREGRDAGAWGLRPARLYGRHA